MALTSYVDQPLPLLPKRRKRFLRMYFVRFSNALLRVERKQRLVSEGTATTKKRESFPMLVPVHTWQGVWSPEIWSKAGSESRGFIAQENMGNGVEFHVGGWWPRNLEKGLSRVRIKA